MAQLLTIVSPTPRRRMGSRAAASMLLLCCLVIMSDPSKAFVSSFHTSSPLLDPIGVAWRGQSRYFQSIHINQHQNVLQRSQWERSSKEGSITSLNSFMGSDGGLFGIGTPELATILLVGYFVLGPSDLYKLVKEIGKFVNNIRTLGTQATAQFETTMESQLELQEIRKAQRELNDAFSFRRSINVDDEGEAFSTEPGPKEPVPDVPMAGATTATAAAAPSENAAPPKRAKKRRRVKKKQPQPAPEEPTLNMEGSPVNNIPDLDMSSAFPDPAMATAESTGTGATKDEKKDDWFADDMPSASDMAKEDMEWLNLGIDDDSSSEKTAPDVAKLDPVEEAAAQSRFQQQMNASWNQKVIENEDKLAPLAMIMERLAILEDEKAAAERRLDDEFRERYRLEEEYYQKKREVLEQSAAKVQQDAYVTMQSSSKNV